MAEAASKKYVQDTMEKAIKDLQKYSQPRTGILMPAPPQPGDGAQLEIRHTFIGGVHKLWSKGPDNKWRSTTLS